MTVTLDQRVCLTIFQTQMVKDSTDSKISSLMVEVFFFYFKLIAVCRAFFLFLSVTELLTKRNLADQAVGTILCSLKFFLNDQFYVIGNVTFRTEIQLSACFFITSEKILNLCTHSWNCYGQIVCCPTLADRSSLVNECEQL